MYHKRKKKRHKTGIKIFWLLVDFQLFLLTIYYFHSPNYTSSVNYFCEKLFTLKNEVTTSPKPSVWYIFLQPNLQRPYIVHSLRLFENLLFSSLIKPCLMASITKD